MKKFVLFTILALAFSAAANAQNNPAAGGSFNPAQPGTIGAVTPGNATVNNLTVNGTCTGCTAASTAVPRPNTRRWAYIAADGNNGLPSNLGTGDKILAFSSNGSTTGALATATLPVRMIESTGSAVSANADIGSQVLDVVGRNVRWETYMRVVSFTTARYWIGLVTAALNATDTPTSATAAFRASTAASDTTYQCYLANGTTANVINSAVTIDTNFHKFEIVETTSSHTWTFFIDGTQVCSSATDTPPSATLMNQEILAAVPSGSTSISFELAWFYDEVDF